MQVAISPDQRAILGLLLERGLSYEEIADATGIGAAEARDRALAGLAAIGGAAPHPHVSDFILGRAGPDDRGSALDRLASHPPENALARRIASGLREEFPEADLPPIPRPGSRSGRFPVGLVAGAAGVVCIVVAILLFAGVLGGDGEDPVNATEEAVDPGAPISIALEPLGDGPARGVAAIGLDPDREPFLDLELEALPAAPPGQIYMLWVDNGLGRGLPLPSPLRVSADGSLTESFRLAPQLIPILDLGKNLELITVSGQKLRSLSEQVGSAGQNGPTDEDDLPQRPGPVVLTGPIPDR